MASYKKNRTHIEIFGLERAQEINTKISKTLSKPRETIQCLFCAEDIIVKVCGRRKKFCDHTCALKYRWKFTDTSITKKKIGQANSKPKVIRVCLACQKTYETYPCREESKFCSQECCGKFYAGREAWNDGLTKETDERVKQYAETLSIVNKGHWTGSKNPCWTGGLTLPYGPEFNADLKDSVRHRDSYECQICSMSEEEHLIVWGTELNVHHIDYEKLHNIMSNLISLCKQCHTRTNHNRDYWRELLTNRMVTYYSTKIG